MTLGIMQPYLFPYIGYFQLINAVDQFVVYDNIKYTKKGWINRNRLLQNGRDVTFTVPLKKAQDKLDIFNREISDDFDPTKLLNIFKGNYSKAPHYKSVSILLEKVLRYQNNNLFHYLYNSIVQTCDFLEIDTEILISSNLKADHSLAAEKRVISLCESVGAKTYVNPKGGIELYNKENFYLSGIELKFLSTNRIEYKQFDEPFVPSLSIVDLLMFNSKDKVSQFLAEYKFT
jgi:hypothetical protein